MQTTNMLAMRREIATMILSSSVAVNLKEHKRIHLEEIVKADDCGCLMIMKMNIPN